MAWRRPGASHYLNQWWFVHRRIYASLGLNELMDHDQYRTGHETYSSHLSSLWLVILMGLEQDCSNSIVNALELLHSCTKPSLCCVVLSKMCTVITWSVLPKILTIDNPLLTRKQDWGTRSRSTWVLNFWYSCFTHTHEFQSTCTRTRGQVLRYLYKYWHEYWYSMVHLQCMGENHYTCETNCLFYRYDGFRPYIANVP